MLLPTGETVSNTVGLCTAHHSRVTGGIGGHKSWITLDPETGQFFWNDRKRGGEDWIQVGAIGEDAPEEVSDDRCPTCGHARHTAKPLPKRKAKTWAVAVPDDSEDGAEVLDGYVEDFATIFGFSDESARLRRYHVLARVLQWASMNRIDLIREWEEAGA